MQLHELSNIRLVNQKISGSEFQTPKEIVSWIGAMQAQDFNMAKIAVGIRLIQSKEREIQTALDRGDILRIHVMRPTWHFVTAEDIYWMLALTAPKILTSLKSRHKQLELSGEIFKKSRAILEQKLSGGRSLNREELALAYHNVKISTDQNRLSHLLLHAELEGIICSGPLKGKRQTHSILQERVPFKKILQKDEALAELARRYFTSHGPATPEDFAWWSGLSLGEAKKALEFIKPDFISETIGSQVFWFPASRTYSDPESSSVFLLPAYDEFLISYKDRRPSLEFIHNKKAISNNGIFRPVIIENGQVIGLWKFVSAKNEMFIEPKLFFNPGKIILDKIRKEAEKVGCFSGKPVKMSEMNIL